VIELKITEKEWNIKEILNVRRGRTRPQRVECENRYSDCFVYVLSGQAQYLFDNTLFTAKAGDIIYLSHNSNYSINVTDENYTFIFADFYFQKDNGMAFDNYIYSSKSISLLKSCFEKLYNMWQFGDFADKIYCKSLLYEIFSKITKQSFSKYISKTKKQQLENIVEYIYKNIGICDINISELSNMLNVSEVHFRRLFKHTYHISPKAFITSTKINKAKELLRDDKLSISDIAHTCGFMNHYYFSKTFKEQTNMTPSEYKKLYKNSI